jgi:threonine dehydratase
MITYADILAARERIQDGIEFTPCDSSRALSEVLGCEVYCKLESLQATGSFKERGARNALLLLEPAQRLRGVISASAGNHALALAYHGRQLGIEVTVVMPLFAPLIKQVRCQQLGAKVILHGNTFTAARQRADQIREVEGQTYIHGFNDPAIIAGQGTLGLEILEQLPECDAIVIPVGGAGLIAGVALAVKELSSRTKIIGVEPEVSPSFAVSLRHGAATAVPLFPTLADGLAVAQVGSNAFPLARSGVDRTVTVSEAEIAQAVIRHIEYEKCIVEGAASTPLAAMLAGKLPELRGQRVVLLISGGNVDLTVLSRLIETALVMDGRRLRFTTVISDRPGGLAELTKLLADCGASVHDLFHDRDFSGPNVATVRVVCTVETRDGSHSAAILSALRDEGFAVSDSSQPFQSFRPNAG